MIGKAICESKGIYFIPPSPNGVTSAELTQMIITTDTPGIGPSFAVHNTPYYCIEMVGLDSKKWAFNVVNTNGEKNKKGVCETIAVPIDKISGRYIYFYGEAHGSFKIESIELHYQKINA